MPLFRQEVEFYHAIIRIDLGQLEVCFLLSFLAEKIEISIYLLIYCVSASQRIKISKSSLYHRVEEIFAVRMVYFFYKSNNINPLHEQKKKNEKKEITA